MKSFHCGSCSCRGIGCTKYIGTAVMTYPIDYRFVSCNESTNTSKRLTECSHDEIYLIGNTEIIANASAFSSKDTQTMSFINHDRSIILMFKTYNFGKISQVAFHREHPINDD